MLEGAWWALQGPTRFLRSIMQGLLESKSRVCLVSVPLDMPTDLQQAVISYLTREMVINRVISIDAADHISAPPAYQLSRLSGFTAAPIRTVSDLILADALSDVTFVIHGISPSNWMQWALFLQSFDQETRRHERLEALRILVLVPASVSETDIAALRQPVVRFRGVSSRLDMEQFVRTIWPIRDDSIINRVAMATTVEMAAWDPRLAVHLSDLDTETQIAPIRWLKDNSATLARKTPSWADGLVDEWEGRPYIHSMIAAALGDETVLVRRIWLAQSRTIFPVLDEMRRRTVRRYASDLNSMIPYVRSFNGRDHTIDSPDKMEFWDLHTKLNGRASPAVIAFLKLMNKVRTAMAHLDPASYEIIRAVSDACQTIQSHLPQEWYGWDWPRCGQKLILLVGPSCAGKTHYAKEFYPDDDIVSSDAVRLKMFGSLTVTGSQSVIFEKVREEAIRRLQTGKNAVIDATHLKRADRIASIQIAPPGIQIEYVIIDRPLNAKLSQQGWRRERPGLIEQQATEFAREIPLILAGDGIPGIKVHDRRLQ